MKNLSQFDLTLLARGPLWAMELINGTITRNFLLETNKASMDMMHECIELAESGQSKLFLIQRANVPDGILHVDDFKKARIMLSLWSATQFMR